MGLQDMCPACGRPLKKSKTGSCVACGVSVDSPAYEYAQAHAGVADRTKRLRPDWYQIGWLTVFRIAVLIALIFIARELGCENGKDTADNLAIPGAHGPFAWGVQFWDRTANGDSWVKIAVDEPTAIGSPDPDGSQVVRCEVTVENSSWDLVATSSDDFLMWDTVDGEPLEPVGERQTFFLSRDETVTFTLEFLRTDVTKPMCVTGGGPVVASDPDYGWTWHQTYLQWGPGAPD